MPEKRLTRTRDAYEPPKPKPEPRLSHPANNLGAHLKRPTDGEIVTSHHRGAKK